MNPNTFTPKTIEDLCCYWFCVHGETHKSASSLNRDQGILKNYIFPAFGSIPMQELQSRQVSEWFVRLKQSGRLAPKTCNDVLGLLKKICNDAVKWEFLEKNPCMIVQKMKVQEQEMDFWCKEEIQQYLGFWLSKQMPPRILWPVIIALYTGMRRGELIGLKWDCIDMQHRMITVKRSYCKVSKAVKEETKSKMIRRIPINQVLAHHLEKLHKLTGASGYVLSFMYPDTYHKELRKTAVSAGVKPIRFHDLRHTFASNFLMGGGNIYDLQKILGHSSVQVTEKYTHLVPQQLAGKTEVLDY